MILKRSRALTLSTVALTTALIPRRIRAQPETIRVAVSTNDSYAEPYYASDQGFFSRMGLNVDLTFFATSAEIRSAVLANALDIGQTDITPIGNAVSHGIPLAFFAGGAVYASAAPTTLLCVAKNSSIRTAKDLEGQTVATISLQSLLTIALKEWMSKNGADPNAIKFFEMPFPPMAAALGRGTVGAALMVEPFLSAASGDVRVVADPFRAVADSFSVGAYFANRSWIAANRPLARRFAAALYATAVWANAHHDQTAPILSKYAKIDVARIAATTRSTYATSLTPADVQPVLDLSLKYGALDKPIAGPAILMLP